MKLTPLQQTVIRLNKTLPSNDTEIVRWAVDKTRPRIATRHRNGVTVCFSCGNTMVYTGKDRFARCCECGHTVEIIEDDDWLATKRMICYYFASLEVVEGLQVMRTYEVIFRYNAINRLKDYLVREICRHWITADGRWAVTSLRRFIGRLMRNFVKATQKLKTISQITLLLLTMEIFCQNFLWHLARSVS